MITFSAADAGVTRFGADDGLCLDPLLQRENQSLRNHTGSLLPTWEDLKGTVTSLMEAEEEALAASTTGSTGSSTSSSSGAGPSIADLLADGSPLDAGGVGAAEEGEEGEPEAVYDPSWRFWDTGLSSAGVQGLIASDAALSLALNKARNTAFPSLFLPLALS